MHSGAEWLARHRHEGAHEIANFQCFSLHAVVYDAMHVIDHHGVAGQVLSNLVVTAVRRRELAPTKDAARASTPSAHARARVPICPARTQCFCGALSAGPGAGGKRAAAHMLRAIALAVSYCLISTDSCGPRRSGRARGRGRCGVPAWTGDESREREAGCLLQAAPCSESHRRPALGQCCQPPAGDIGIPRAEGSPDQGRGSASPHPLCRRAGNGTRQGRRACNSSVPIDRSRLQ